MSEKSFLSRHGSSYNVVGITVSEAVKLLNEPVRFIDVRDARDFQMTTVDHPDIENMPLLSLLHQMEEIDKSTRFLVIDMDGDLAWKAVNMLLYNDFSFAVYIAGGLLQWKIAEQPVKGQIPDMLNECGGHSCGGCSCGGSC